jgi:hypothetical protein
MIKNNKGFSLFLAVMLVAAVSIIIAAVVTSRSMMLNKVGKGYRHQVDSLQIAHELAVIFANPKLCESLIVVGNGTFKVTGVFEPPVEGKIVAMKGHTSIGVKSMQVEGLTTVPDGQSATFSITTQELNDAKGTSAKKNSLTAVFKPGSDGKISNCRIVITPQAACTDLGFKWNDASARCEICEKMGGTWSSSSVCSLVDGKTKQ